MVLWQLNMLLQCYSRAELHGRVRGRFFLFFLAQVRTRRPISASIPHFNWGGDLHKTQPPFILPHAPLVILAALQPPAGRTPSCLCVCGRASERVSVFSSGSAGGHVLDVAPQQRRIRLVVSYQRVQPLRLVQALPVILRPRLQPSADR